MQLHFYALNPILSSHLKHLRCTCYSIDFKKQGEAFNLAIPTPEHYLPLLYTLGLKSKKDDISIFNNNPLGGSLTMTSVKFG